MAVTGPEAAVAGSLVVGDQLFDDQANDSTTFTDSPIYGTVAVTSVTWDDLHSDLIARPMVYNFEVADTHTYFVGKDLGGVWVHNGCAEPDLDNLDNHAINAMGKRGWTSGDIMDAYQNGEQFLADDYTSRMPDGSPSPATRFVNPNTGEADTLVSGEKGGTLGIVEFLLSCWRSDTLVSEEKGGTLGILEFSLICWRSDTLVSEEKGGTLGSP